MKSLIGEMSRKVSLRPSLQEPLEAVPLDRDQVREGQGFVDVRERVAVADGRASGQRVSLAQVIGRPCQGAPRSPTKGRRSKAPGATARSILETETAQKATPGTAVLPRRPLAGWHRTTGPARGVKDFLARR